MPPQLEVWGRDGVVLVPLDGPRLALGRGESNDVVIDVWWRPLTD